MSLPRYANHARKFETALTVASSAIYMHSAIHIFRVCSPGNLYINFPYLCVGTATTPVSFIYLPAALIEFQQ
jgi:hypothetical protein